MGAVYKAILARLVARGFGSPRAPVRIPKALLVWILIRQYI
jgi:presqualene diphosphate synthase